ncbi:hypothetical protein [Sphingomonas sp. YL-JM2C]
MLMTLPESVHSYCTKPRIKAAVDLLLSSKTPKIPDGLQWSEVEDFYRAWLGAQQTRAEWAIAMNRLWYVSFPDLKSEWQAVSIVKQADESEEYVDLLSVWTEGTFTRDFVHGEYWLELQVELDVDEGLRANVALWKDGWSIKMARPPSSLLVDDWLCSEWLVIGQNAELNLTHIRETTKAMIAVAETCIIAGH